MRLVDDPDHRFWYPPAQCRACGAGLAGAPVFAQRRHQVTDVKPAPPPEVTEHVAQSKMCPCCGAVSEGELPAGVRARAHADETPARAAGGLRYVHLACTAFLGAPPPRTTRAGSPAGSSTART